MSHLEPTLAMAIDLFNQQDFFECHEVLEDLWRPLPPGPEKTFLQGVLQVGVGYYHWQKNNYTGTKNKLESGLEKLLTVVHDTSYQAPVNLPPLLRRVQQDLYTVIEQPNQTLPLYPADTIPQLELI